MKTDILTEGKQVRNSLIYILQVSLGYILPLIAIPIFTRILSPEDYGILALAMIYGIIMSGLANFGVSLAFERNFFQYKDDIRKQSQLLYSSLMFVVGNFTILAIITYLFNQYISQFLLNSGQYGELILTTFAGYFFMNTANNFFFIFFKNSEQAITYTKYRLLINVNNTLCSMFLVLYLRMGVIGIAMGQLVAGASMFLYLTTIFLKKYNFSISKSILLESLKISYPLTPRIMFGVLNSQFDKYMISMLANVSGVGVYHIGKKFSEIIFSFMTALENVFNPQVFQRMFGQHEHSDESIGRYLLPFLYFSIAFALSISLFSEEFITLLTPVSYHGAIPITTILSIYMGFLFFGKITGIQLIYSKKTNIITVITFLSIVLNVGLNIPMIIKFGAIGAAWATMLAGILSCTIGQVWAQHYYPIHFEWIKVAWIKGTFFTGSIIIISMKLMDIPYLWTIPVKIITIAIFLNLGFRYGILSKENYMKVRSIISFRSKVTL